MAITINWATKVISIPKADTTLEDIGPPEIRSLDLDVFRQTLKDIEDSEEGIVFDDTHRHVGPITVGGVTLARVVEIINGYTVTFEDGQYAVNLVGANSNVSDVTNVNQVSIRSANSAGLTYSKQVEDSAFHDARVWINTVDGEAGTIYPIGTSSDPVDNLDDALSIVAVRNLAPRLHLRTDGTPIVLGATDVLDGYDIAGVAPELSGITSVTGASVNKTRIDLCTLSGPWDSMTASDCILNGVSNLSGTMFRCGFDGTTTLGNALDEHDFVDCFSRIPGSAKPIVDCNSLGSITVHFRRYAGGLEIRNMVSGDLSIDLSTGSVLLDSTCTGGTIVVRGVGELTDNSGAGCTVIRTGLVEATKDQVTLVQKLLRNRLDTNPSTGIATLYDDDGVTPLLSGPIYEDVAATQPYRGQGLERRNRLT